MRFYKTYDSTPQGESALSDDIVRSVYGDLVTFLMALFVILMAITINQDESTFFSKMRVKFGGKVIEQEKVLTSEDLFISQLQGYIEEEELSKVGKIKVDEQRIKLILDQPVLFDTGKADLKLSASELLRRLSLILKEVENPIIVEGHTDNIPIHNRQFKSNWELSFHRAFSVVEYFIHQAGIKPQQLITRGSGEYAPIASNDTVEGRAKNRRIEISIIRVLESK